MHRFLKFIFGIELYVLYVFFWVIPRRLNFICRRFGTLCLFHLPRQVGYPEENIQHTEHGESLKSRELYVFRTGFLSIIRSLVLYTQQ
jgi:hypothetical protein